MSKVDNGKTYEKFDVATRGFSAWALMAGGQYTGRVVITRGRGLRVTAFVQIFGAQMQQGHADGSGYDKDTAAVEAATAKLTQLQHPDDDPKAREALDRFVRWMRGPDGEHWYRRIESGGFNAHNITG